MIGKGFIVKRVKIAMLMLLAGTGPCYAVQVPLIKAGVQGEYPHGMVSPPVLRNLQCQEQIRKISGFVGFDAEHSALLTMGKQNGQQVQLPIVMEVAAGELGSAYVSTTFSSSSSDTCRATYDAVVYWPLSCDVVMQHFPGMHAQGVVKQKITVLNGGDNSKVFLMPAGDSGCVSIKKEIVL